MEVIIRGLYSNNGKGGGNYYDILGGSGFGVEGLRFRASGIE